MGITPWTLSKAERTFFQFPKIASAVLSLHLLPGKFAPFLPRSTSAIRCYLGMAATSSSTATDAETLRRDRILSSKLYFDVPPSKVFPHLSNKPSRSSHLNPFRVVLFPRFPWSTQLRTTSRFSGLRNCKLIPFFPSNLFNFSLLSQLSYHIFLRVFRGETVGATAFLALGCCFFFESSVVL